MKIASVGGGPAVYCANLLKRARPVADIHLVEQNPANATFGFGVVFSEQALGFLAKDDPETHACITPHIEARNDLTVVHHDFVYSYITRSGRIGDERLSRIAPSFMADYLRNRRASGTG